MLLDKILLVIVVQRVAVHFEILLVLCQGLHLTVELGKGSERNGGKLIGWQEHIFGGVMVNVRLSYMLLGCWGCKGKMCVKLPFAVACNFLKTFSAEQHVLDLCLGQEVEFRLCELQWCFESSLVWPI